MSDTTAMEAADTPVIQIDGFVKTILIVIAIILGVMGANHMGKIAKANPQKPQQEQQSCGESIKPCYVRKV